MRAAELSEMLVVLTVSFFHCCEPRLTCLGIWSSSYHLGTPSPIGSNTVGHICLDLTRHPRRLTFLVDNRKGDGICRDSSDIPNTI